MENKFFLEMRGICKTFPGAKVLNNIEINMKPGEVRAIMGENGAGKSTLIKILGGIYSKDAGSGVIKINGEEVEIHDVQDARRLGISIIHQEICLADNMTVADNLFMGCELLNKTKCFMADREMIKRAQAVIDELEVDIDVRQKVGELSIAKQQMVEISRALLTNARLIVMDEPTSSLTQAEIEQLFLQIEKLKRSKIAIIYISHRMDEIFRVADSVSVLRDGDLIGTDLAENLDTDKIISMMVGRQLSEIYLREVQLNPGEECLKVCNFNNSKLHNISFSLRKGEILGFAGLVGAGRTELARAIFGIDSLESGELYLKGQKKVIKSPKDAIESKIAYVPENRKTEGLFLGNAIHYNITISILEKFIRFIGVNRKKEHDIAEHYGNFLNIKMASAEQLVRYLSGGNQQKVVLSKWLATEPEILILDEPTRGIDIGAKSEIYRLIYRLAGQGAAIILISSEMEEIINLSTRVIVMYEGEIKGMIEAEDMEKITQEKVMWHASGGKQHEEG